MNQKQIRFLKNLSTGLVVIAVVFAFLIAGIRIFGVQAYGVLTGSMEPTYPTIIRYRTKGDANKDVDASLVSANNVIGKAMFAVPQMGYLANYIQQPPGIYVAILVCGLMIAFVFYTDLLDSKQQADVQPSRANGKPGFDITAWVNHLSQKLLGKPLLKEKQPAEPALSRGYNISPSRNTRSNTHSRRTMDRCPISSPPICSNLPSCRKAASPSPLCRPSREHFLSRGIAGQAECNHIPARSCTTT